MKLQSTISMIALIILQILIIAAELCDMVSIVNITIIEMCIILYYIINYFDENRTVVSAWCRTCDGKSIELYISETDEDKLFDDNNKSCVNRFIELKTVDTNMNSGYYMQYYYDYKDHTIKINLKILNAIQVISKMFSCGNDVRALVSPDIYCKYIMKLNCSDDIFDYILKFKYIIFKRGEITDNVVTKSCKQLLDTQIYLPNMHVTSILNFDHLSFDYDSVLKHRRKYYNWKCGNFRITRENTRPNVDRHMKWFMMLFSVGVLELTYMMITSKDRIINFAKRIVL
jgi:predicted DNA binding protein